MDLEIGDKFLLTILIITIFLGLLSNFLIDYQSKKRLKNKKEKINKYLKGETNEF